MVNSCYKLYWLNIADYSFWKLQKPHWGRQCLWYTRLELMPNLIMNLEGLVEDVTETNKVLASFKYLILNSHSQWLIKKPLPAAILLFLEYEQMKWALRLMIISITASQKFGAFICSVTISLSYIPGCNYCSSPPAQLPFCIIIRAKIYPQVFN